LGAEVFFDRGPDNQRQGVPGRPARATGDNGQAFGFHRTILAAAGSEITAISQITAIQ
jgi:hypothetical protein